MCEYRYEMLQSKQRPKREQLGGRKRITDHEVNRKTRVADLERLVSIQ